MALYTMLPNGLTAISTAAAQHRLLAIDSAGALFLSNDFGKSWEPIAQQWTSKALQVRVNKSLSSRPAPSAPNQTSAPQAESGVSRPHFALPPTPSAVFEIVTDDGSIWTSPDGKTWKAK